MNRDIQNFTGLERAVDHAPNPAIAFLQHQDVVVPYEGHRRRLAQARRKLAHAEVRIAHRLSKNSGSATTEPECKRKPAAEIQLPPIVFVEHVEFAPVSLRYPLVYLLRDSRVSGKFVNSGSL